MGVDRKQRDYDANAGYGSKYRKKQGAEYFLVRFVHVINSKHNSISFG
jgi:hypothetical protein